MRENAWVSEPTVPSGVPGRPAGDRSVSVREPAEFAGTIGPQGRLDGLYRNYSPRSFKGA